MTKTTEIEADLDAEGTRHTRPGGKGADARARERDSRALLRPSQLS